MWATVNAVPGRTAVPAARPAARGRPRTARGRGPRAGCASRRGRGSGGPSRASKPPLAGPASGTGRLSPPRSTSSTASAAPPRTTLSRTGGKASEAKNVTSRAPRRASGQARHEPERARRRARRPRAPALRQRTSNGAGRPSKRTRIRRFSRRRAARRARPARLAASRDLGRERRGVVLLRRHAEGERVEVAGDVGREAASACSSSRTSVKEKLWACAGAGTPTTRSGKSRRIGHELSSPQARTTRPPCYQGGVDASRREFLTTAVAGALTASATLARPQASRRRPTPGPSSAAAPAHGRDALGGAAARGALDARRRRGGCRVLGRDRRRRRLRRQPEGRAAGARPRERRAALGVPDRGRDRRVVAVRRLRPRVRRRPGGRRPRGARRDGKEAWRSRRPERSAPRRSCPAASCWSAPTTRGCTRSTRRPGPRAGASRPRDRCTRPAPWPTGSRTWPAATASLRAIRWPTARQAFELGSGGYTGASPAIHAGRAYYGTFEDEVLGVDLRARKPLWRYRHERAALSVLLVGRARRRSGRARRARPHRARARRSRRASPPGRSRRARGSTPRPRSPAAASTWARATGGSTRSTSKTGKVLESFEAGAGITASPAIAAGRLVVAARRRAGLLLRPQGLTRARRAALARLRPTRGREVTTGPCSRPGANLADNGFTTKQGERP